MSDVKSRKKARCRVYFTMPTDMNGIERELQDIKKRREKRGEASTLYNLFNSSGITSVKYQGKDGRGVLLEDPEQLETLKQVLGPVLSSPDQMSVVINLRAKAWEGLADAATVSPREAKAEQAMWEALTAEKLALQLQMQQENEADRVPARRTNKRTTKWYMENDSGDVVDLDLDALVPGTYVCAAGSEDWMTAVEAGLVAPKPKRRQPAKRKAKPEAEAEAAESN